MRLYNDGRHKKCLPHFCNKEKSRPDESTVAYYRYKKADSQSAKKKLIEETGLEPATYKSKRITLPNWAHIEAILLKNYRIDDLSREKINFSKKYWKISKSISN